MLLWAGAVVAGQAGGRGFFGRRRYLQPLLAAAVAISVRLQLASVLFWGRCIVVRRAFQRRVVHFALKLGKLHL